MIDWNDPGERANRVSVNKGRNRLPERARVQAAQFIRNASSSERIEKRWRSAQRADVDGEN